MNTTRPMQRWFARRRIRFSANLGHELTGLFLGVILAWPSGAAARHPNAKDGDGTSVDVCSRHPEMFKVRRLTADEAARLIRLQSGMSALAKPAEGTLISGECTRFIKTFANLVMLTNNSRFVMTDTALIPAPRAGPGTGPHPFPFTPPPNITKIAANGFVRGNALSYVQNLPYGEHTRLVLWSDRKQSVVGTIRCTGGDGNSCTLGHLILSSPHRIRQFGFIPAPDAESAVGSLWLWITLRPGEQVLGGYMIDKG
jgi:hypothetical protein